MTVCRFLNWKMLPKQARDYENGWSYILSSHWILCHLFPPVDTMKTMEGKWILVWFLVGPANLVGCCIYTGTFDLSLKNSACICKYLKVSVMVHESKCVAYLMTDCKKILHDLFAIRFWVIEFPVLVADDKPQKR